MCFHCYTLVIANNSGNKKNAGVLNHNFANVLFIYMWSFPMAHTNNFSEIDTIKESLTF